MNTFDGIPILSQIKSAIQAAAGDLKGASITQDNFSKKCIVVSQLRSAVESGIFQDHQAATNTQLEFINGRNLASQGTILLSAIACPWISSALVAGILW